MSDEPTTEPTPRQRGQAKPPKRSKRNYKGELEALQIQVGFAVAILERVTGTDAIDVKLVSIALEQLKK